MHRRPRTGVPLTKIISFTIIVLHNFRTLHEQAAIRSCHNVMRRTLLLQLGPVCSSRGRVVARDTSAGVTASHRMSFMMLLPAL